MGQPRSGRGRNAKYIVQLLFDGKEERCEDGDSEWRMDRDGSFFDNLMCDEGRIVEWLNGYNGKRLATYRQSGAKLMQNQG